MIAGESAAPVCGHAVSAAGSALLIGRRIVPDQAGIAGHGNGADAYGKDDAGHKSRRQHPQPGRAPERRFPQLLLGRLRRCFFLLLYRTLNRMVSRFFFQRDGIDRTLRCSGFFWRCGPQGVFLCRCIGLYLRLLWCCSFPQTNIRRYRAPGACRIVNAFYLQGSPGSRVSGVPAGAPAASVLSAAGFSFGDIVYLVSLFSGEFDVETFHAINSSSFPKQLVSVFNPYFSGSM